MTMIWFPRHYGVRSQLSSWISMNLVPCCRQRVPSCVPRQIVSYFESGGGQAYASVEILKKSRSMCYKCGVRGHLARDCTSKKKDGESSFDSRLARVVVEAVVPV